MKKVFCIMILIWFSGQVLGQINKKELIKGFSNVTFYSDSTIKSASHLKNNKLEGYSIEFNEKGQAIRIGEYHNDKKKGWWINSDNTCDYYIDGNANVADLNITCNTNKPNDFQSLYVNILHKVDCKAKLDMKIENLNGNWKFMSAEFYPTKGEKESKVYPDHYLLFNNDRFAVKTGTTSYQSGKIRIEKQNSSKALNCDCQVWFKSKGEVPFDSTDLPGYYDFWTINTCTTDSLVLCSPWNCEFIAPGGEQKRCGLVEKIYVRQK